MNILTDKKKLIQILFGLAFIILIANIVVNKLGVNHYTPVESSITGQAINSKYLRALKNYGILDTWIKKEKKNKRDDDSLLNKYKVEVPQDLPIALLINEITGSLDTSNVKIQSQELKIGGATLLKIFSGDNLKLQSTFNYSNEIVRKAGTKGLIVTETEKLNDAEFSSLMKSPERFAVLFTPTKSNKKRIDQVINDQKEIIALIGDESTDMDYKMRAGFSEDRIKNSVRAIISDYSRAAFFILDDRAEIYSSNAMKIIRNVLDRGNIKYIKLSDCSRLNTSAETAALKQFDEFVKKTAGNKSLLLISPAELYSIIPELVKFRKIGYKFLKPSVIKNENQVVK